MHPCHARAAIVEPFKEAVTAQCGRPCNKPLACKERKSKLERRYDTGGWCDADLVEFEDKTLGHVLTNDVSQVVTV